MKKNSCLRCPILGQSCPGLEHPALDSKSNVAFSSGLTPTARRTAAAAFTLVEVMVAVFIAAIFLPSFYVCLGAGFAIAKETREDLRATQIILQRMEAIRLSPYKLLQNPASYPTNVTEYYCPSGQANGAGGAAYTVNYNWAPGPTTLPPSYRSNMLVVTVSATWKSGNVQRSRTNQTYVARYGIQRLVSGN